MQESSRDFSSDSIVLEYDDRFKDPSARHDFMVGFERKSARSEDKRSDSF